MMRIVNNINRKLKKANLLAYLTWKTIIPQKKVPESNNILLVSGGGIGDAVIDASAWYALIEYYTKRGKTVYLAASKENWNILNKVLNISKFTYIQVENGRNMSKKAMAATLSKIDKLSYDSIIARAHGNIFTNMGIATLRSWNKYVVLEPVHGWRKVAMKRLIDRYTGVVVETIGMNEKESLEQLLHLIGLADYNMKILPIPRQDTEIDFGKKYITVSVDSQNPNRRWGSSKFIELFDKLLESYDSDIIVTGNNLPDNEIQLYTETYKDEDRVKITIGQLSFNEWMEALRGAWFHIGVDSGSIHIAASVGTVAFCLTGVWHGHLFFPYSINEYLPGTVAPVCVYRSDTDVDNLECFACAIKTGRYGGINQECMRRCCADQSCLCLEKINVEDVIDAIQHAESSGII